MTRSAPAHHPSGRRGRSAPPPLADRLDLLRMRLLGDHPFWRHLLVPMRFVAVPDLPAPAATDCIRHIWYRPDVLADLDDGELGFILMHELCHVAFVSTQRRRGRLRALWNRACDFAINRIVASLCHPAPRHAAGNRPGPPTGATGAMPWARSGRGALYAPPTFAFADGTRRCPLLDPRFDGMPAESIYDALLSEAPVVEVNVVLSLPWSDHRPMAAPDRRRTDPLTDADGGRRLIQGVGDHGGGIDIHLPEELIERCREEVEERVHEAIDRWRESGMQGIGPPLEAMRATTPASAFGLDWRTLFRQHADHALGLDEYTLARPHRRYLADDLIVPGPIGERPRRVIIALDTSASMSDTFVGRALSETVSLAQAAEECVLLVGDQAVRAVIPGAQLAGQVTAPRIPGGGGTDHRPFFAWVADHGPAPDLFVGISDLFSTLPATAPGYPVLWVVPPRHRAPPWGEVVVVRN